MSAMLELLQELQCSHGDAGFWSLLVICIVLVMTIIFLRQTLSTDLAEKICLEKFLSVRVLRMLVCSILGTVKVREAQSRNRLSIRPGDRVRESIFHQKTKQ